MIEIENVTKRYGDNTVVDDVSLRVDKGQVAVIVGTSGSGKTTLLMAIAGFTRPETGRIVIGDRRGRTGRRTFRVRPRPALPGRRPIGRWALDRVNS